MTLNPQFTICSCLSVQSDHRHQRAPLTRAKNPAKKNKKNKCDVSRRRSLLTCRYPPGLRRNARRWPRLPGSRNPDGSPPCSQLQHGLSTPELQPADKPADRAALRGTETLMDHKGCSWTHRRSANRYHLRLTAGRAGLDWRQREATRHAIEGRRPRSRGVTTRGETSPHRLPNPPYTYLVKDWIIIIINKKGREKENMRIASFFPANEIEKQ